MPDRTGLPGNLGNLRRIDTFQWTCNFELVGQWGERRVLKRPVDESDRTELSGVVCYRADVIHNFYAISRAIYERAPSDFRLKVDEHFDHFVRLKSIGAHVYFTPEVTVDHHSRPWSNDSSHPVEAKFARVRNTGGQYHPFVRENWGLHPDRAWGIKITKVPFLDRRPKTPAAALTGAGRPNIIVLTPGRTGSGLLVKQLIALGWQANGTAEEFGEIPALYELNQRMLDSRSWPAAERDRLLSHLKAPWVLEDPRMIDLWDFWLRPIERQFGKPLVIWSVRDPQSMREKLQCGRLDRRTVGASPGTGESDLRGV